MSHSGWLVLEPFITPAFYQKYQDFPGFDSAEWTLSQAMRADTGPGGGIEQISKHYAEFIVSRPRSISTTPLTPIAIASPLVITAIDRTRLCRYCCGRPELDPSPDSVLGDRSLGG